MSAAARIRPALAWVGALLAAAAVWQGLFWGHLLPHEAVPGPLAVAREVWSNRDLYGPSLIATLLSAAVGYLLGNAAAIAAGVLFALSPTAERVARGFNLIIFAIPPITLGPLLAIAFQGALPQIILAAAGVYFTTMTVTVLGLKRVDPNALALVRLYGGDEFSALRWVRLRSGLPTILSGLRAGATAAILGAMLGEFGSGAPGLGSFLLASMSLGQPERVWGIALVVTSASLLAYAGLSWLANRFSWRPVSTLALGGALQHPGTPAGGRPWRRGLTLALAAALPFLAWQTLPILLNISPAVAQTPAALWAYLVTAPDAGMVRQSIAAAAAQTLPLALGGMLLGGAASLLLAIAGDIRPALGRALLAPVILLQSTPLVALTPLIVLALGRGALATLAIALSVCFFPAFVILSQAVKAAPPAALDILRLYGGGRLQTLRLVTLPYMTPALFAAARLAAPTALLGVMTAEWLATGYGIGGLMNEARGNLDYGMIWTVAFLSVALAAGLYQLILAAERPVLRRLFETG